MRGGPSFIPADACREVERLRVIALRDLPPRARRKRPRQPAIVRPSFETAAYGGLLRMRVYLRRNFNPHGEGAAKPRVSNHEAPNGNQAMRLLCPCGEGGDTEANRLRPRSA